MKIDIAGKRAIVAGGSRGIGRAIALAFAEAGAGVSICARGAEALEATRDEIARHRGAAHAAVCDLSDAVAIPRYIAEAADALGGVDILVNNASGFGTSDDEAGWAASISVDLLATVRATRAALPYLEKSEAGSILNISSISGFRASVRTPPYGAVKAAILEYTLTQAAALARKRHPGQLHRPRLDRISGRHLGAGQGQQSEPLRRHPQEHPIRPARPSRGGGAGRAVPVLAARQLGHRPEHCRRWRADALRPMRSSSSAAADRRRCGDDWRSASGSSSEAPRRCSCSRAAAADQCRKRN